MSTVIDLAVIRARRAASAPDDLLSDPLVVLLTRQILERMPLDKERGKMRSAAEYVAVLRNSFRS